MKKNNMSFFDKLKDMDIDDITIIVRRAIIILLIVFVVGIIINRFAKDTHEEENIQKPIVQENNNDDYSKKDGSVYFKQLKIEKADVASFQDLGSKYAKDKYHAYYKGEIMENVSPTKFKVLEDEPEGLIVNSDNLLKLLEDRTNRLFLMNNIGSILTSYTNVKNNLKGASENSMWKFRKDVTDLEQYKRGQNIPQEQRAKFGVIFLYIKIIKNLSSDKIKMKMAMTELRKFMEETSKRQLPDEVEKLRNINGDMAMDKYCIYVDGELFTCFLDKIFNK